jgi:hypothetical protein
MPQLGRKSAFERAQGHLGLTIALPVRWFIAPNIAPKKHSTWPLCRFAAEVTGAEKTVLPRSNFTSSTKDYDGSYPPTSALIQESGEMEE